MLDGWEVHSYAMIPYLCLELGNIINTICV